MCTGAYIYLHVLLQNMQDMDERRTVKLGETYRSFAEVERKVIPIVSKCLEGMVTAAKNVDERKVCSDTQMNICTAKLQTDIDHFFPAENLCTNKKHILHIL